MATLVSRSTSLLPIGQYGPFQLEDIQFRYGTANEDLQEGNPIDARISDMVVNTGFQLLMDSNTNLQNYFLQPVVYSPHAILGDIRVVQQEFPDLYRRCDLQVRELAVRRFASSAYEERTDFETPPRPVVTAVVNQPVSEYKGSRLILGCGHQDDTEHHHSNEYCIDINPRMNPDIVGDCTDVDMWRNIPDQRFNTVQFEGFGLRPSRVVMREIHRILVPGGVAQIINDTFYRWLNAEVSDDGRTEAARFFNDCGFERVDTFGGPNEAYWIHAYKPGGGFLNRNCSIL
jgi:hypothetical protein